MTIQAIKPSLIYVSDKQDLSQFATLPAYERIGRLYANLVASMRPGPITEQTEVFFTALKKLGIERQEPTASFALHVLRIALPQKSCLPLVVTTKDKDHDPSGIYLFRDETKPLTEPAGKPNELVTENVLFAMKAGSKRAHEEALVAKLAHWTGLADHSIAIFPCVLQNPPVDPNNKENEEFGLAETLWSGREKVYTSNPQYLVGAIQPFMQKRVDPLTVDEFAKIVLLSLVIGLRDGKSDGIINDVVFDVDDCFPVAIDPKPFKNVEALQTSGIAATDLHFLENLQLSSQPLENQTVENLANLVKAWNVDQLCELLAQEKVLFVDKIVERAPLEVITRDESGASFETVEGNPHKINGLQAAVKVQETTPILGAKQIQACHKRMTRLQTFILGKQKEGASFTSLDMVYAVDPFFKIYADAINGTPALVANLTEERRFTTFTIVGNIVPASLVKSLRQSQGVLTSLSGQMFEAVKAHPELSATTDEDRREEKSSLETKQAKDSSGSKSKKPKAVKKTPMARIHLPTSSPWSLTID